MLSRLTLGCVFVVVVVYGRLRSVVASPSSLCGANFDQGALQMHFVGLCLRWSWVARGYCLLPQRNIHDIQHQQSMIRGCPLGHLSKGHMGRTTAFDILYWIGSSSTVARSHRTNSVWFCPASGEVGRSFSDSIEFDGCRPNSAKFRVISRQLRPNAVRCRHSVAAFRH